MIFIDAITAIIAGVMAGRMGIMNFVIYIGAAAVIAAIASVLIYYGATLAFRIEKAMRRDEPISPEDQRIIDAVKKANALMREELLRNGD